MELSAAALVLEKAIEGPVDAPQRVRLADELDQALRALAGRIAAALEPAGASIDNADQ